MKTGINLRFHGWSKVVRTLASAAHLSIRYESVETLEQMGVGAYTDGRELVVPGPDTSWNDRQFDEWVYKILHEMGHNMPSRRELFDALPARAATPMRKIILNILEDMQMEWSLVRELPATYGWMSKGRAAFYKDVTVKWAPKVHEMDARITALFAFEATYRKSWSPTAHKAAMLHVIPFLSTVPGAREWYDILVAEFGDWMGLPLEVNSVVLLSDAVWIRMMTPEEQQQEQQGQGQGKPGDGEMTGQGQGPGEGGVISGEHQFEDISIGSPHENLSPQQKHGCTIKYKDGLPRVHGAWVPGDESEMHIFDTTRGDWPSHDETTQNPMPAPSTLKRTILRYIQANSKDRKEHGKKSGRLSGSKLYRLKVPGAGTWRKRVFHKQVPNNKKDIAVTLLCDLSGSMSDVDKRVGLVNAVAHMHEVLASLKIPTEIVGFSVARGPRGNTAAHVILQKHGITRRNADVVTGLRRVATFSGGNQDGESILWAAGRLLKVRAARRLLIVLSDGHPTDGRGSRGDIHIFTRDAVNEIDARPDIDVYGIGINSEAVHHFYPKGKYGVIWDPTELEQTLLRVLKHKIIDEGNT